MNWSAFTDGFFKGLAAPCALLGMFSPEYGKAQVDPPAIDLDAVLSGEPFVTGAPQVRPEARGGIRDDMAAVYGDFVRALGRM